MQGLGDTVKVTCPVVRGCVCAVVLGLVFGAGGPRRAQAWPNLLEDPGFEDYDLDPRGFYRPEPNSPWEETTLGRGSVQLDECAKPLNLSGA